MKRISALLIAVLALIGFTAGEGPAAVIGRAAEVPENLGAIDAVIVLDQSMSMRNTVPGQNQNDPNDYRLDAAQMLISMSNTNGSRVAFIPFSQNIEPYADTGFVDISSISDRNRKLDEIGGLRTINLKPDTNLGAALAMAVKMVLERTDTRNAPMIVVLSDGQNDFNKTLPTFQGLIWDDGSQSFVGHAYKNFSKADSDKLMRSAASVAQKNGIPIYTIALYNKDATPAQIEAYATELEAMAVNSERHFKVSSDDASLLPQFFGQMFARQVGSRMLKLTNKPIEGNPGWYSVELPILNLSVEEANIIIPLESIRQEKGSPSVKLFDAGGNNVSSGSGDVIRLGSHNFMLFKIVRPQTIGDWRLEFELKDPAGNPDDVSFSLLYNYDIMLKTFSGKDKGSLAEAQGPVTLFKNDRLVLESRFFDNNGQPSADRHLYDVNPGEAWKTIRASYQIIEVATQTVIASGDMPVDGGRFVAAIDLKTLQVAGDGINLLRSGAYELMVTAEGAGLYRENAVSLDIQNNPPSARAGMLTKEISVDDPRDPKTQAVQEFFINLNEYVQDPDNDAVRFADLNLVSGEGIVTLELTTDAAGNPVLRGQTVKGPAGAFQYGDAQFTVQALDGESESTIPLTVHVASKSSDIQSKYETRSLIDGVTYPAGTDPASVPPPMGAAAKNSPILVTMTVHKKPGGARLNSDEIKDFFGTLSVYDQQDSSVAIETIPFVYNEQESRFEATYTTQNHAIGLIVKGVITYGHTKAFVGDCEYQFQVPNQAPTVKADAVLALPGRITYDPLPEFLSFLEKPTDPAAAQIDLGSLFEDADQEAGLNYHDPLVTHQNQSVDPASIAVFARTGNQVQFTPVSAGQLTLTFTAEDGDRQTAQFTHELTVESVLAKWIRIGIIAAIALASLIVLILIIHQARKPRFPYDGVLSVKEHGSIYLSGQYEMAPSKKHLKLSHALDGDLVSKYALNAAQLDTIYLRPLRGASQNIGIYSKKKLSGIVVQLEGLEVGKKLVTWGKGQVLTLRNPGRTEALSVQYNAGEDSEVASAGGGDSFAGTGGGDFDWSSGSTDSSQPSQGASSPKKNDDFDF